MLYYLSLWGRSSAGRVLASHARSQGFESPRLHHKSSNTDLSVLLLFFLAEMMGESPQGATRWNHFVELSAEKQRDSRNARTERTTFESPRLHHKSSNTDLSVLLLFFLSEMMGENPKAQPGGITLQRLVQKNKGTRGTRVQNALPVACETICFFIFIW